MNTKTDVQENSFDVVKFLLALSVLVVSLVGFYYYADASKLFRVLGVLTGVGISGAIVASTVKGKNAISFVREAQVEVRKIVWPTRQETLQTTLFVMIVVIVFAILLWVLDLGLSSSIQALIGRGV
jgi:preprotein translocase subunit SecE|tara:strand:- start:434 stop:811 length:378 start_codon:yes stop_codon:yes gene_type:complete